MDTATILHFLSEFAYLLVVFFAFLSLTIIFGRQMVINIIFGLYLALLITIQFPYYDKVLNGLENTVATSVTKLVFFAVVTILTTLLFKRLMPEEYAENKFESFGKKILLAMLATVLVMIFSFNVLPVTELLTPGTPIQSLFAPQEFFFWWLLLPLLLLPFL